MDVPAPEIKVVLDPEYTAALRESVMATITSAVADARQKAYIDSDWVSKKKHIAKYLDISEQTLNVLIKQGLPIHYLGDADVYSGNKHEMTQWILNNM